jgi:hypothetical protein
MTNSKQETIEEAAERILSKEGVKLHPSGLETYLKGNVINAMVGMVKWQGERMYSEEEVLDITKQAYAMGRSNYTIQAFNKWFEQVKK